VKLDAYLARGSNSQRRTKTRRVEGNYADGVRMVKLDASLAREVTASGLGMVKLDATVSDERIGESTNGNVHIDRPAEASAQCVLTYGA